MHFACKFGCASVVNVLCSHPAIDKHRRNKYQQKPCEIICERMKEKNKIPEIRQKILEYLEDRCYVPLLRAADNSAQPLIGAPWSPEPVENLSARLPRSPREPVMAVRAFAGPLSPSKADEFRRVWKTPPRGRAEHFHHILKSDPERGAERVGRDLAHELGHPWAEYWDFLDSFVDLVSVEGLWHLEEFLSKKEFSERARDTEPNNSNKFRTPSPGKQKKFSNSVSVGAFLDESDISLEEMKNRQNAALTSISSSSSSSPGSSKDDQGGRGFHILPVSQDSALIEPQNPASSYLPSPISNLMAEFERMTLRDQSDGGGQEGAELSSTSSDEFFLAQENPGGEEREEPRARIRTGSNGLICSRSRSWDHGSSASSSTSGSYRSLDHSNDLIVTPPPRVRRGLFIEGDAPCRLDRDVFNALGAAQLDPLKYPSIHKWKNTIESYSNTEMQSWQTPAVLKTHSRLQSLTPGSPVGRYSPVRHVFSPDHTSPGRYSPAHCSYSPTHASYIQRIRLKHLGDSPI